MTRPLGIDLFAGAGGLSLGFEQAGFDIAAAVEIDPVHACVHKFNFPNCAVIPASIQNLSGPDIRIRAGIGQRKIDVVFGGAPCQGFSLIGHRALDDPRNSLVKDFVRIVGELEPNFFVFENVKGLTVGKHKAFLNEVIEEFKSYGYKVLTPWQVLNAHNFVVPQGRARLFLIGAREGLELPNYPDMLTRPAGRPDGKCSLPEGPTCFDALGDLPDAESFDGLSKTDEIETGCWGKPSAYARGLRCFSNDAWRYGHPRIWDPETLTSSLRTRHTEISRRRFAETSPGSVEPISRFFKLSSDGVSNTLRAGTDSARGAFTSPRPIHYAYPRCVTVREMARLHGFPDWFRFHTTKWHGARQVGNSVPPPLARAVASKILEAAGIKPIRSKVAQKLGDPQLLHMCMTDAAAYWDVPVPIGRRDQKSGARKRKQHETEAERLSALNEIRTA